MKMSDGVEQAIHCVALLAGISEHSVLSAAALAELHGVSASYLLKHLQALSNAGIVDTFPGPKGGYSLARAPTDISLLDILLAVEGPAPAFRCSEIRRRGPNPLHGSYFIKPCGINSAMLQAERAYRAALAKVAIADLVSEPNSSDRGAVAARSCAFIALNERRKPRRSLEKRNE